MGEERKKIEMSEVDIRVKDILVECARQMKMVIILAILGALFFICLGIYSDNKSREEEINYGEKLEYSYEEAYAMLKESDIKTLNDLKSLESQYLFLEDYILNAERMNADYFQIPVSILEFYVDADDKESELNIFSLYQTYIETGGLVEDIVLETEDIRYIAELISYSNTGNVTDENFSTVFSIKIYASSEEKTQDLVERVKKQMHKYSEIMDTVLGEHELIVIDQSNSVIVDSNLLTYQDSQKEMLLTLEEQIKQKKAGLSNLQRYVYNYHVDDEEENSSQIATSSVSYGRNIIIGSLFGVIIAIFIIVIHFVFDKTIKNSFEIQKMYSIRNLGLVYNSARRKYQRVIDKFAYGKNVELSSTILSANIDNAVRNVIDEEIAIIGKYGQDDAGLLSDIFAEKKAQTRLIGDVLQDRQAIENLPKHKNVILVVKERGITYIDLYQTLLLCEQEEINIIGYITIV